MIITLTSEIKSGLSLPVNTTQKNLQDLLQGEEENARVIVLKEEKETVIAIEMIEVPHATTVVKKDTLLGSAGQAAVQSLLDVIEDLGVQDLLGSDEDQDLLVEMTLVIQETL